MLLRSWIYVSAVLTGGGWMLSMLGSLTETGYGLLGAAAVFGYFCFFGRPQGVFRAFPGKLRRRFSRPIPFMYLLLAVLSILGGLIHPPVNVDGLSYRIPRVLHWLAEERWHWIHTSDVRLNVVATGFDWLSAPILLFFKSDRAIVLINAASFLLLPGSVFLAMHRLGVKRRVAANFMWIIPAGFCYFMQAGSIANDLYAAIFALSAIGFGLRYSERRSLGDLWTSILALALATGAKQTLLPFLLPWALAVARARRDLWHKPLKLTLVLLLAAGASYLPTAILNLHYSGAMLGFRSGADYAPANPFWGVVGNGFWLLFSNLQPPIIPWAGWWNELRLDFLASSFGEPFRSFEIFGFLPRAASEQFSGLGCTVLILILASWIAARRKGAIQAVWNIEKWIRLSIWLGLLVFMAKVGINQSPRYLAAWYPFLAASLLLHPELDRVVRTRWWTRLAVLVASVSVVLAVASRQRPLFPVGAALSAAQSFSGTERLQKVIRSYAFAHAVQSELETFLAQIPPEELEIGYAARFGTKETFLWRPYFSRRVRRVLNSDSPETIRKLPIDYIVVDPSALSQVHDPAIVRESPSPRSDISSIEEWLAAYKAELVGTGQFLAAPEGPAMAIYLVKLKR